MSDDDGRRFIPWDYVDEITPAGREHPDAWIKKQAQRGVFFHHVEDESEDGIAVAAGAVVNFFWQVELAILPATIMRDGGVVMGPQTLAMLPASYTRVCTTYGEGGKSADNVQGIGAAYLDDWDDWPGNGTQAVDVSLYFMSEGDEKFRLVSAADGGDLHFVEERTVN